MELTGAPLLVTSVVVTVIAAAATVAGWRLPRRRLRMPARVVGILLCEVLAMGTAGLILNRVEDFYPSWAALAGHTGGDVTTQPQRRGVLDRQLAGRLGTGSATALPWQPVGATSWRLGGPATMVVPGDYLRRASAAFPAMLLLTDGSAASAQAEAALTTTTDVVGVVVAPTPRTTAGDLAVRLPARLGQDLRVAGRGWFLIANAAQAPLARSMLHTAPDRFRALAVIAAAPPGASPGASPAEPGTSTGQAGTAAVKTRAGAGKPGAGKPGTGKPSAGAVKHGAGVGAGKVGPCVAGVVTVTGTAAGAWRAAVGWAARLAPAPLAPPQVLPTAGSTR